MKGMGRNEDARCDGWGFGDLWWNVTRAELGDWAVWAAGERKSGDRAEAAIDV